MPAYRTQCQAEGMEQVKEGHVNKAVSFGLCVPLGMCTIRAPSPSVLAQDLPGLCITQAEACFERVPPPFSFTLKTVVRYSSLPLSFFWLSLHQGSI